MTSLAFTFGVIPLMLSHGAGAEMRTTIGTAVFWGMIGVTLFGIFLTPVFYVVIRRMLGARHRTASHETAPGTAPAGTALGLLLLGTVSVVLLNGCAVGPDYHRPETPVSAAFANANQTPTSTNQTAVTWWRGFNDPELERLIDLAVAGNHDLRIAAARVLEARALRSQAILSALPIVQSGASYTNSLASRDLEPGYTRSQRELSLFTAGFDAAWEVDIFGGARRAIQAASAGVAATEESRRDVLVSLIAEVARNYFELRGAQHELEVARKNAENQRQTLELTEARLRAGRATELDTARARAQWEAAEAGLPPIEAAIKHALHRASVLVGRPPAALEGELVSPAPLPPLPPMLSIGTPAELLRRRPDIRAAERSLALATALVGVQTADLFPKVTFSGSLAFQATQLSGLGGPGSDTYAFGPGITWPALDLGRVRAAIKAAKASAEAQLAAYEKTVLTALEETENALVDFGRQQAQRDHLAASARSSALAVDLANQRYRSGMVDFLIVLDAERTQLAVEDQLAQSQTRTATALVAVYKALGGGWEIERQTAAAAPGKPSRR
jgi:multidrug efflux system outer membrane protein